MSLLGCCCSKLALSLCSLAVPLSRCSLLSFWVVFGPLPESIRHLLKGRRSCICFSVLIKGLQRQGASFMTTSLSFNNKSMMDYLNADIHSKLTSKGREGKENKIMLFDSSRTICGSKQMCVSVFVCLYSFLVWLLLSEEIGRFLPLAPSPFPPLIMASWVQADSSSCLFSLIYQPRDDKCKHLPS